MKIIIAAEIFSPEIGGPATYSKQLAEQLSQQGWQVKIICYSDKQHSDSYPFEVFRITRSKFKPWHYYKYFKTLKKISADCDIVYAQGPVGSGQPALKVKQQTDKKLVVKVVGDYAWEQARNKGQIKLSIEEFQKQKFSGKIGLLQKIERQVCQAADKIVVPSEYLKKIVSGWGVDESKIEVIYNSFGLKHLIDKKNVDPNSIISVGRLVDWKGFDTLIELMPDLIKKNEKFKLTIFGDGPEREKLNQLVGKLGLENHVFIAGRIDHQELLSKLHAGVFVLNTGYEGLSHIILEAMAAGTPVITTKVGGNPEIITDGQNGILVEYNNKDQLKDAILKLHNDDNLRQKFINNSKEVLKKFTFEAMITKTIKVLKNN